LRRGLTLGECFQDGVTVSVRRTARPLYRLDFEQQHFFFRFTGVATVAEAKVLLAAAVGVDPQDLVASGHTDAAQIAQAGPRILFVRQAMNKYDFLDANETYTVEFPAESPVSVADVKQALRKFLGDAEFGLADNGVPLVDGADFAPAGRLAITWPFIVDGARVFLPQTLTFADLSAQVPGASVFCGGRKCDPVQTLGTIPSGAALIIAAVPRTISFAGIDSVNPALTLDEFLREFPTAGGRVFTDGGRPLTLESLIYPVADPAFRTPPDIDEPVAVVVRYATSVVNGVFERQQTIRDIRAYIEDMEPQIYVEYDLYFDNQILSERDRVGDLAIDNARIEIEARTVLFILPKGEVRARRNDTLLWQTVGDIMAQLKLRAPGSTAFFEDSPPSRGKVALVGLGRLLNSDKTLADQGIRVPARIFVHVPEENPFAGQREQPAPIAAMAKRAVIVRDEGKAEIRETLAMATGMTLRELAGVIRQRAAAAGTPISFVHRSGKERRLCTRMEPVPTSGELVAIVHRKEKAEIPDPETDPHRMLLWLCGGDTEAADFAQSKLTWPGFGASWPLNWE
jgi:hypothetical protein